MSGSDESPAGGSHADDLRALLRALPDLVFILSRDDVFLDAYAGDPSLFLVPPEHFIGRHVREILPDLASAIANLSARARQGAGVQTLEYEITLGGRLFSFEARLSAFDGGKVAVVSRDVTARREAEENLRRAEAEMRRAKTFHETLLATAAEGIAVYHPQTEPPYARFTLWNQRMTAITGFTMAEINERGWLNALFPDPDARRQAEARIRASQPPVRNEEWTITNKSGDERVLAASTSVVEAEDPAESVYVTLVHDLTDRDRTEEARRRLEMRVQQTQKLESLGLLAGGIAHDFNNLLTAMIGYADLALKTLPSSTEPHRMVSAIEEAAGCAVDLTRQMLTYAGHDDVAMETVRLDDVVRDMVRLLEAGPGKPLPLESDLEPAAARGDASQLRQIAMNLLANAADATAQSGSIRVRTGLRFATADTLQSPYLRQDLPEGHYAWLEVHDTGHGMDADTLARVFDPFFSTKVAGRGLGLAAALGIVRSHGGTINVTSEPGRGTTFEVWLPSDVDRTAAAADTGEQQPVTSGRVLLVEDNPTARAFVEEALRQARFDVIVAADGREAMTLFSQHADRLVAAVIDFAMPRLSGADLATALRRANPALPILLMSGYAEGDVRRATSPMGHEFIRKPFRSDDLVRKLRWMLADATEQSQASRPE